MKRVLCPILLGLLLSGCWDYSEVTMQDYVTGVGIDWLPSGGYHVSIELQNLAEDGGRVVESAGAGVFEAIRNVISHAGKKLYWGHCDLIVVGETVTGARLTEVRDVFNRAQDVYLNTTLAMARGTSAAAVFQTRTDTTVSARLGHIFENEPSSRRFRNIELWEIPRSMDERGGYLLPTVVLADGTPAVSGGAVFCEDRLLGFLSGDETLLCSLLTRARSGGFLNQIRIPSGRAVSFEIIENHTEITRGTHTVLVRPCLTLSLSGTDGALELADPRTRRELERTVADSLTSGFRALWQRARREGFASLLALSDATPVRFAVDVKLGNMGMYESPAALGV